MQDFAYQDVRSVSAMLTNQGDGREQAWLDFEKRYPELAPEALIEFFSREVRYGRILQHNLLTKYLNKHMYLLAVMFVALIL